MQPSSSLDLTFHSFYAVPNFAMRYLAVSPHLPVFIGARKV